MRCSPGWETRNAINVLSSQVIVACGSGGAGTASEVALALKSGKPVILLVPDPSAAVFFRRLCGRVLQASSPEEAVALIERHGLLSTTD